MTRREASLARVMLYSRSLSCIGTSRNIFMPKLKTHKGASKRFKKTGTGKVVRGHAFARHILTSKPHKRKKKLHERVVADKTNQPALKRMLPY